MRGIGAMKRLICTVLLLALVASLLVGCGRTRDDGKVDLGVWSESDKKNLILPLDVHVYDQATALGLTGRKQKDIVTAQEITDAFREIWPEDPCKGDFALFGYGVNNKR